ncbi:MAG TPA: hypothetical protein VKV79_06490 [Terriglobia bacterium]|nr:hypothetical protein [Terriglobia bacterium]
MLFKFLALLAADAGNAPGDGKPWCAEELRDGPGDPYLYFIAE